MSTEREIRLIGVFRDDITPKLEKLNKTINETVKTFSRFTRALRPLAKEMGTVAYAGKTLESSLTSQRNSFQAAARSMVAYRRELRRTASLQKMVAGGRLVPSDFMTGPRATRSGTMPRPGAQTSYSQRRAAAGRGGAGRIPGGPMPVIPQMPRTPRAPRGMQPPMIPMVPGGRPPIPPAPRGGASVPAPPISGPSMADGAAGAAFGVTLGSQIGSIITNAIMTGFQKSMQLIKKPFTFLAHEFGHAMGEEMADITASGAMYALDKSRGTKMFKDFEDTRQAQEMLDQRLAKSASSLPGQTLQYVQQARQLQDTVMMALGKDQEGFMKKAEEMGAIAGNMKDSFAVVLSQFTERAVLLDMGAGGQSRGLGVPQLLEQMVGMQTVKIQSMGMRYGALQTNPLLKAALERNEAAINATTVGTIERIAAIQKALDEALPQEVITAMTMTMKGISEGFRSSLFDISAGLFGIRRMVTGVKAQAFKMTGEVKADVAEALSLFDMLRDTIGFFVVPFLQLANILPQIYDPMLGLIDTLIPLRKLGAGFALRFHGFAKGFEDFAKEAFPDVKTQAKFLETRGPRAALRAMVDLLHAFDPSFVSDDIVKELLKVDADFGMVAKDMITRLLNSDVMEMIGETVGNFASELLTVMANLVTGVTDFATTSRFAQGLVKGLEGRIGKDGEKIGMSAWQAIRTIFDKVFEIMGKLLLTIVTQMPMQIALFVGITAVLPAAIAALGTKIGMGLGAVLSKVGSAVQASLTGTDIATAAASMPAGRPPAVMPGPRAPGTLGPKGGGFIPAFDKLKQPNIIAPVKAAFAYIAQEIRAAFALLKMGKFGAVFQGLLTPFKAMGGAIKNLPDLFVKGARGLGKFGGAITAVIAAFDVFGALLSGKDIWESLGAAAGPVVGTIIGFALGGPIGAAIGSFIGGLEPVTTFFTGVFKGLGDVFGAVGVTIGPIFEGLGTAIMSIIGAAGSLISMFNPFAGALSSATGEIDTMKAIIIATKIVLWPIVGAFQLFEQVINLVVAGLKGLELAILYARYGLSQLNPKNWAGASEEQIRLADSIRRVEGELDEANSKFGESFARHSQYYVTEVDKTSSSVKKLNAAISATGSSFENNKKYVDEAGKAWGWAMANGEKVAVEWGSVAGTALKNVADSANKAAKNLKPLSAKDAIAQGKASGLTPNASDLEWYKRQTAYQTQLSNSTLTAKDAIEKNLASGLTASAADMEWYRKKMVGTGNALDNLSTNAGKAATNITEYQKKTREAIAQGRASGLTPTAADMEWYNKVKGKPAAPPPAANVPAAVPPSVANPIPAIQALNTKQAGTNALLAQINAKTLPQGQVNPIPAIQALNVKQAGANALLAQLKTQVVTSEDGVKRQIGETSRAQQAKIQGVTTAINNLPAKFSAGMPVRVINAPTVKFDMGGIGPVGGGIGGFPKTSGYGMRWGKMHTGNDYGMPVGTKLGIGGPGKVLGAGYWGGYGNTMDIGGPGGMVYRFAHLSKFNAPVGANLPPGYPFALSGNTGSSTGPHLHFEARPGGLGPVNPDAFAGIIRANFGGTPLGPLMGAMGTEMQNMPYGSQLAVSNSDEIFMKPKQMAHVIESSARAGAEGVGNVSMSGVTININGYDKDPKELTDSIASELLTAIYRKSRSEVLTS